MSLISIIMPYYKKRNFVKNSILSVINQSHQDFEIIVIKMELTESNLKQII